MTPVKISAVSEAQVELRDHGRESTLEISGSFLQRKRARKYAQCVMKQRIGPLFITEGNIDDDLSVLTIPAEAVGFVQGQGGNFMRTIEEEWGTLISSST